MTEPSNPTQNQFGPCGILCGSCPLGSGAVAESAGLTRKHITDCQIPMWSPFVPGGEAIDWAAVDRALDWMTTYARLRHQDLRPRAGLCSSCADLEGCTRFDWLEEYGKEVKEKLKEGRGLSREEDIKNLNSITGWLKTHKWKKVLRCSEWVWGKV